MADAQAVVAGRNFLVKAAPWDDTNAIPADTVVYGGAWGAPWVDRGYTNGGIQFNMNLTRGEVRVDQEFDPITRPITGRNITMSTGFAEMTPANLQLASGMGTIDTVAAGSGTRGHNDLIIDATLTDLYYSWGFDIRQPDGEAFRVVIYKGLATGNPNPQFTPENAATIALEVSALVDTSTDPSRVALVRDVIPALP
jgi:hypothetical protein